MTIHFVEDCGKAPTSWRIIESCFTQLLGAIASMGSGSSWISVGGLPQLVRRMHFKLLALI
jgi:hypothetical protein